MEIEHSGKASPIRLLGQVIAWAVGSILVLTGLLGLLGVRGLGGVIMSLGICAAGAIILPPLVAYTRRRFHAPISPLVPPLVCIAVLVTTTLVSFGIKTASGEITRPTAGRVTGTAGLGKSGVPKRVQAQSRAEALVEVERLIGLGTEDSTTAALVILNDRFGRELRSDPQLKSLLDRANAASAKASAAQRASEYAFRASGHWLKAVQDIPLEPPTSMGDIWLRVAAFEEAARQIKEGEEFEENAEAAAARRKLSQATQQRQRLAFPILRAAFGKLLRDTLWERDIEVTVQGPGNRTIRFIGGIFAANRNIASAQRTAQVNLDKLRFGRSQYEWYGGSRAPYYTLKPQPDGALGYWEDDTFVSADVTR